MAEADRIKALARVSERRRLWHGINAYLPPIYAALSDNEFDLLLDWFDASEEANLIGECGIPAVSLLQALIAGNGLSRIVQCGHYSGYSTLLLGMCLRRMGVKNGFLSIDIDPVSSAFSQYWIEKVGLTEHVRLVLADSSDPLMSDLAHSHLGGSPQLVFIDSSHQYRHTLEELDLWSRCIAPQGFLCMHDVSETASSFDATRRGGVKRAVLEWTLSNARNGVFINCAGQMFPTPYLDPCGFGLMQIPHGLPLARSRPADEVNRRIVRDFHVADVWIKGAGWSVADGVAKKIPGELSALACYAPVKPNETYEFKVDVSEMSVGRIYIDVGASGSTDKYIEGSGVHTVRVAGGGKNGMVAIVASADFDGTVAGVTGVVARATLERSAE